MTSITQVELAERWELTKGRISQLVAEGCPLTSFEDAENWRAKRYADTGFPNSGMTTEPERPTQEIKPSNIESFDAIVEKQRMLVQIARSQYMKAVREGSPQQSKLYASYDKTVMTLTKLKGEADRLLVFTKTFVKREEAEEAMRQLMGEVLAVLDKLGLDCAEKCNPDNPAMAIKALDAWTHSARNILSKDETQKDA